jgi:hypothetical protein
VWSLRELKHRAGEAVGSCRGGKLCGVVADQEGHPNCIGHGLLVGGSSGLCTEEVRIKVTCDL